MKRLAETDLFKKMENSLSGELNTELAPFYRRFCVVIVSLLSCTLIGYFYYCHYNDYYKDAGIDKHVPTIWFIIIQSR